MSAVIAYTIVYRTGGALKHVWKVSLTQDNLVTATSVLKGVRGMGHEAHLVEHPMGVPVPLPQRRTLRYKAEFQAWSLDEWWALLAEE